ncbi:hypothetical protein [Listeria seeligeri]|nr:hypothetical protein [Listeria seeligeri]
MSAIGIFSKKEKKSFQLIAIFIIFGLVIFWISCVMYLGLMDFMIIKKVCAFDRRMFFAYFTFFGVNRKR